MRFNVNHDTNEHSEFWKLTISRLKKQIEQDEQDFKQIISELQKNLTKSQRFTSLTVN